MRYMSPLKKSLSKKWVRYISRRKHTSVTRGRSIPLLLFFFASYCLIKLHGYLLDHYDVLVSDRADVGLVKTITEYGLGDTDALTLDEWTDASESSEQVVSQTTPMVRNTSSIPSHYSNTPPFPITVKDTETRDRIIKAPVEKPNGLMHRANPPGSNAIVGLAAYPNNMRTWVRLIGGLRQTGYDGHIIFGVHKDIPDTEQEYLKEMDVTYYSVQMVDCDESVVAIEANGNVPNIRGKCAKGLERLNLEWGRFEMARQWLYACETCTGWSLVMDTRDVFFQADPFASLPPPAKSKEDLLFIEEVAKHTSPKPEPSRWFEINNVRFRSRVGPCYGRNFTAFLERPVLCSGTIIGTKNGIHRFLSILVHEFYANNQKKNQRCKAPHMTDQWNMNYLYYTGKFGYYDRTTSLPWGTGPVLTIGKPCVNNQLPNPNHSQNDMVEFDNVTGFILNNWEKDGSKARIAPVVHQFDRCHRWILPFFCRHSDMYKNGTTSILEWK